MISTTMAPLEKRPVRNDTPAKPTVLFDSICRRFKDVIALDEVSCAVAAGHFHAIVGENGAGKSTLMKILSGSLQPDSGRILLDGMPHTFRSPADALHAGIGMVYQHFSLIPSLSVLDNIVVGDRRTPFWLRRRALAEKVEAMAADFGFHFDLSAPVWRLRMPERQKLEIFKLLWRDARVLILDEPTSQLAPFEAEDVLNTLSDLARGGRTVLLVSHHLQEVLQFCSQITVLRRGRLVGTVDPRNTRLAELASLVVGELSPVPSSDARAASNSAPVLSLRHVSIRATPATRALHDVSLDVYSGEMLGIAGVVGSGEEELAALLTGQLQPHKGTLLLDGKETAWKALAWPGARVSHIPADARGEGSIPNLSLTDNFFLRAAVRPDGSFGLILNRQAMRRQAEDWLYALDVRPADPDLLCGALSGGNLQRLVLTREMFAPSDVLVAVNPTAGLNIAAAEEVRRVLRQVATGGAGQSARAVVLISTDLSELLLCDRIAVLHAGAIAGVEQARNLDAESLGLLMGGVKADLVRALRRGSPTADGQDELRAVLYQLLVSPDWWQRRLAAQVGFGLFDVKDQTVLAARLSAEDHPAVRAWLLLALARLAPEDHLTDLTSAFETAGRDAASPQVLELLGAQMHLLGSEDLPSLRQTLAERLGNQRAPWEVVLGYYVLRSLGADEAEQYRGPASERLEQAGPQSRSRERRQ